MSLNSTFRGFQQHLMVAAAMVATIVADEGMSGGRETGSKNINRKRVPVTKIFQNLGAKYIRKAYRMQERSFWILLDLIEPHMSTSRKRKRGISVKRAFFTAAEITKLIMEKQLEVRTIGEAGTVCMSEIGHFGHNPFWRALRGPRFFLARRRDQ